MYVVHEHEKEGDAAAWRTVVFHRSSGKRYPPEAKVILGIQAENRRIVKEKAQIANASKGKRQKGKVS